MQVNLKTLKTCRHQFGLTIEEAGRKAEIASKLMRRIEEGHEQPTPKQLESLGDLYGIPRWVLNAKELPERYHYGAQPSFRTFQKKEVFQDSKVRQFVAKMLRYRDFLVELREDIEDPLTPFSDLAISIPEESPIEEAAESVREWLELDGVLEFNELRKQVERKSIFVFLTSKYAGWSKIDKEAFRGLCITHETCPIIIVNDSDAKKALSFTLLHELGHLLKNTTSIQGWNKNFTQEEKWCDELAGRILMPESHLKQEVNLHLQEQETPLRDLKAIQNIAHIFKASSYACAVRIRQSGLISQECYEKIVEEIKKLYEKRQGGQRGMWRNRPNEVRRQFGDVFVNTVLTAWHYRELTLHRTSQILDLKNPEYVLELSK